MPTGYTNDLERRKYDVRNWLKENVIRAMGVCVSLRDRGDMSSAQIMEALKKEKIDNYHSTKLKESQEAYDIFKTSNEAQLRIRYCEKLDKARREFAVSSKEFEVKKLKHLNAISETTTLYNQALAEKQDEVIVNTLKFALDQLNQALDFDYRGGPYRDKILDQDFESWQAELRKDLLWNIEYHAKELPKEEHRHFDRYASYKKYVDWIDSK